MAFPRFSRKQRDWYFLYQQLRNRKLREAPAIITADVVLATLGDSMTDQQSDATPNHFENLGYVPALQLVTGNRYVWNDSLNFGKSGETTGLILARAAAVRDACLAAGVTELIYLAGANDRRLKYTAQYTIDNIVATAAIFTAAGINFNVLTTFYATDNFYLTKNSTLFTSAEVAQCKADVLAVNVAIRAMEGGKVRVIEVFDVMVSNGVAIAANLQSDELHENATGGWKMMERIDARLTPLYGIRGFTLSPNNKLANPNFAGTTGSISGSRETGVLATGHATAGSAPVGTPASRTYFKPSANVQRMTFSFPSGGSTRDNMRCANRYTSSAETGKTAWYECEIRINDVGAGAGIWHALSAEMVTSASSDLAIGYDRGASTEKVPVDLMKSFCDTYGRTLLIRTPKAIVPAGVTYVEGRVNLECDTTAGPRSGAVELLNEQLVIA